MSPCCLIFFEHWVGSLRNYFGGGTFWGGAWHANIIFIVCHLPLHFLWWGWGLYQSVEVNIVYEVEGKTPK